MTNAPYTNPQPQYPQAVHLSAWKVSLLVLIVLGGLAGTWWWLLHTTPAPIMGQAAADTAAWPAWLKQANTYQPPEEPVKPPPARDETAEQLLALRREMDAHRRELEALKNKPQPKPAGPAPQKRPHAPMLFVEHKVQEEAAPANTYTLAPGATKVPCLLETAMHSDVPGHFLCKVTTNVYDTATGRHLLVPQGSTVLGQYDSGSLLYGNERIPTVSLTLTLPDGRTVDLGQSPVTDAQGMAGLTGTVESKFWKLVGAVFIGGALRGGAQMVQLGAGQAGMLGAVPGGIAQSGSQVVNQRVGRTLDSRPSITVPAGTLCQVLLLKPLQLRAIGE
jgi:type IV secretory pathway VirB10-like protein